MQADPPLCPVNILDPAVRAAPYGVYARLREEAPVCRLPFGPWLVTRRADVAYLLSGEVCDHWAQAPQAGSVSPVEQALSDALGLMNPDGRSGIRQAVVAALAPARLKRIEAHIADAALRRVHAAGSDGAIDAMDGFAVPLTLEAASLLMGFDVASGGRLGVAAAALDGNVFAALRLPGGNPEAGLAEAMTQAIAGSESEDGLVARITRAAPDLSPARLHNLLLLILFAAHQNLAAFIGNAVVALSEQRDAAAELVGKAHIPAGAVLELLRLDSPIQYISLSARRDLDIAGQRIAAGAAILACIGAANRDPAAWNEPDRLDFSRDARALLSFGLGPWRCVGAGLAQSVAAVLLSTLLAASGLPVLVDAPEWNGSGPFVHRGPRSLHVRIGHG